GSDRDPDVGRRPGAEDGGHGLLSPQREGDGAGVLAAGKPRGQRPGAGAAGTGADRPAGTRRVACGQRRAETGHLRARRHRALIAVEHELRLSSAEVTDVVRRISLLAQKNAPLRLSFTEGTLTISAQTPDVGE